MADVRFGWRMALKNPWMSAASVLALGAAMAVTIGGFSLLWDSYYAVLPFPSGERIVAIRDLLQPDPDDAPPRLAVFREWEARQTTLDRLAATYRRERDVADGAGGLTRYPVAAMTASGFAVAGVAPLIGQTFTAADQAAGARPVVVISFRVWRSLFGADPEVVGRTLEVGGEDRAVVGVMPEGFRFPMSEDLWVPLDTDPATTGGVEPRWLRVFGRLAPGVEPARAQAELDAIRAGYAGEHPEDADVRDRRTTVVPYVEAESEPGTDVLFQAMFVFVLLVLVVASASVANLLLARATSRSVEMAVRAAMGASRRRLVAQLFIEALILTTAGAVVGVVAAHLGLSWFGAQLAVEMVPFWVRFGISPPVALCAVVAALAAAAIAGIAPALKATGGALHAVLKSGPRTASDLRFGRVSGALTVLEVAVSVACLAAAALAAQSQLQAARSNQRLPADRVLVADVTLADEAAVDSAGGVHVRAGAIPPSEWPEVQNAIRTAVAGLPGVRLVALADSLPGQQHQSARVEIEDQTAGEPAVGVRALTAAASPELFGVFDQALLLGRAFGGADSREAPAVAIVNAPFARRFFGQRNPVGERFRTAAGAERSPWIRIVGVADLQMNPSGASAAGFYRPLAQTDTNALRLAIRVDADPMTLPAAVREAVKGVDPRLDIAGFATHETMARGFLVSYEIMSLTFGALGGTALFLAVAGLYAVMAFSVARRTREIGIRVALGADRRRVMGVVMRHGVRQMAAGVVLGGAAGWVLLRLLSLIPIGVSSSGTGLLAAAVATMLAAGLVACVGPAVRAMGIRPVEALRHD